MLSRRHLFCCLSILIALPALADWPYYGGFAASTKFAPYDQIHAGNIDSRPRGGFWDEFGGMTPLHMAVWVDRAEMLGFLLERGADPMVTDLNYQAPPIGWATVLNRESSLAVLQKAMAAMQEEASAAAE